MKLTKIWPEEWGRSPTITVSSKHPKLENVELPLHCAVPRVLCTQKGRVAEYLLDYKPTLHDEGEDNVTLTRHCLYVTKEVYDAVKKCYDKWAATPEAKGYVARYYP